MIECSGPYQEDILRSLAQLRHSRTPIPLAWQYKGLLIERPAQIVATGSDWAEFQSASLVLSTLSASEIFLKIPPFEKPVRACLEELDASRGTLRLSGFFLHRAGWQDRRHARVQPKTPLYVSLTAGKQRLRAALEDLSLGGMGLLGYKLPPEERLLQPGAGLHVEFASPGQAEQMRLRAAVVYRRPLSLELTRLGLACFPDRQAAKTLEAYISRRAEETLMEVRQDFIHGQAHGSAAELYF